MSTFPIELVKRSPKFILPYSQGSRERVAFVASMQSTAEGLSRITGKKIRFHAVVDNDCAQWGDFAWFIVEDPEPYRYITDRVTDQGVEGHFEEVNPSV